MKELNRLKVVLAEQKKTGKDIHEWCTVCNRYCFFNHEAKCRGCWDENTHNVLVQEIGATPICGIETNGYAVLNSAFIIIANKINPYIQLGLINSKLLKFYWSQIFEYRRNTFSKIRERYLELIPTKHTNEESFVSLVQLIVEHSYYKSDIIKEVKNR